MNYCYQRRTSSGTSHSPVHSIPPYDNGQQNGDFAREEELASMMARGLSRDQALKLYQQKQVSSGGSVSGRSAHSHTSRLSAMNNDYPSPKSHVRARSEIPTGFLKSSDDQGDAMLSPTRKTHSIGGFFGSQGGSAESHSGKKASLSDFFDDLDNVSVSSRVRKGNHEDFDDGPQLQHSRNRSVSGGITPVTDSRIGIGGRKPVSKEFYSELDHASATALQRNNSRSSLDKANRRFSKSSFDGNEDDSSPLYQEPEYNDSNEKNPPGYKSSPLSEREKMQRRANFSEHESKIIELTERLTREETRRKMAEEDCDELKKKMKELERSYEESEKKVKIRLESVSINCVSLKFVLITFLNSNWMRLFPLIKKRSLS